MPLHRCSLALVLLAGCAHYPGPRHPADDVELGAVAAAIGAWTDAGRPAPAGENCEKLQRVIIVLPDDINDACARATCNCGQGGACYFGTNPTVASPVHLAIYLGPDLDAQGRLNGIVHETLHAIRACVLYDALHTEGGQPMLRWGVAPDDPREDPPTLPDHDHRDLELWGSIQNDALSRVQLRNL